MNNLDKQILNIFNKIVNGYISLTKIDYEKHYLYYEHNGIDIILGIYNCEKEKDYSNHYSNIETVLENKCFGYSIGEWMIRSFTTDNKFNTHFNIIIEGKRYIVPKLSRVEEAKAIEAIELSIQQYEESLVLEILR